ncbi:unnamed protein product [Sympodiomycopsis kandeliae]
MLVRNSAARVRVLARQSSARQLEPSPVRRQYSSSSSTSAGAVNSSSRNLFIGAAAVSATALVAYRLGSSSNGKEPDQRTVTPGEAFRSDKQQSHTTHDNGPSFDTALSQIKSRFAQRPDAYSTEPTDLEQKGFSSWCQHDASLPAVIVYPCSTDDVVTIVNIARENRVPLIPFAGGTSLEAHWYAPRDPLTGETKPSITIAFDEMSDIVEYDDASGFVRVQPGLGWQDLNEELKSRGSQLFWPIDPGPGANFGGMLATGGSGTGAVRYGTMKGDLILNLTVVLPSGEVIKTRSDARKSSAGPDLTKLFLGSEGTLGVITEATLRLVPRLQESVLAVSFHSVDEACRAVGEILNRGIGVSSIELLDDYMIKAINAASNPSPPWQETLPATLFIKFSGSQVHTKEDQRQSLEIVRKYHSDQKSIRISKSQEEVDEIWHSRKIALWSAMEFRNEAGKLYLQEQNGSQQEKGEPRCWTTDVCVPIGKLPNLVSSVKKLLRENNLYGPIVGHVGDGNFHSLIVYRDGDSEEFARAKKVVSEMVKLAQDLGGTCTGEHGIGRGKREYIERELGKGTVQLLKSIKDVVDPTGFMNPGALLPTPAEI